MSESSNMSYNTLDVELSDPSAIDQPQLKNQGGTACRRLKTVLLFSLVATIACGTFFMGRASVSEGDASELSEHPFLQHAKEHASDGLMDSLHNFEPSDFLKEYSVAYPSARELNDAANSAFAALYKRLAQIQGLDGMFYGFLGLDDNRNDHLPTEIPPTGVPATTPEEMEKIYLWQTIKNHYARHILYQMIDSHVLSVAGHVLNIVLGSIIRNCDPASDPTLSLGFIDQILCELFPDMCTNYDGGKDGKDGQDSSPSPSLPNNNMGGLGLADFGLELFGASLCSDFAYTCIMCTSGCATVFENANFADLNGNIHPYAARLGGPEQYCATFCSQDDNPFIPLSGRRRVQTDESKSSRMKAEDVAFGSARSVKIDASDAFTCLTDGIHDHLEKIADEAFQTTEFKHLKDCFTDPRALWFNEAIDDQEQNVMDCISPANGFLSLSSTLVQVLSYAVNPELGASFDECFEFLRFVGGGTVAPVPYTYTPACPNWIEIGAVTALLEASVSVAACAVETNLMMKEIKGCRLSSGPADLDLSSLVGLLFMVGGQPVAQAGIMETEIPLTQLSEAINALIGVRLMEKIQRSVS